jgi:hypothetical protein
MPCACQNKNIPAYPVADNWGPVVWTILHGLAEKSGNTIPGFYGDEVRKWIQMIEIMPKMIPCEDCRAHAQEWIKKYPITAIKTLPHEQLHDWLVNWVYSFHEDVNQRTGKPSFDRNLLTQTYTNVNFSNLLRALTPLINAAILLSGVTILPWQTWSGFIRILASYY